MRNENPLIVEVTDEWGEIISKELRITLFDANFGGGRRLNGSFSDVYGV